VTRELIQMFGRFLTVRLLPQGGVTPKYYRTTCYSLEYHGGPLLGFPWSPYHFERGPAIFNNGSLYSSVHPSDRRPSSL